MALEPTAVLDSSALLAYLFDEPGADQVEALLGCGLLSALAFAEVADHLAGAGLPPEAAVRELQALGLVVAPLDADLVMAAAALKPSTRIFRLGLGARLAFVLGRRHGRPILTADPAWALPRLDLDVRVLPQAAPAAG